MLYAAFYSPRKNCTVASSEANIILCHRVAYHRLGLMNMNENATDA